MPSSLSAQQQAFLQTYSPLAHDVARATGLHPSVVLGQMAQETGWGRAVGDNNPFGISPGGKVATYPTISAGAQAYVDLIKSRYGKAAEAPTAEAQAQGLQASGYNPDPAYGTKVAQIAQTIRNAGPYAGLTDAQLGASLLGRAPAPGASAQQAAAAPRAAGAPRVSDADLVASLLGPAPPAPAAAAAAPTWLQAGGAGLMRGVRDVIDPPAEFLARTFSPIVGGPSGAQTAAADAATRARYQATYGGNPLATTGRIAGQIATAAPIMAAGGSLLGGGGDVLASAAGRIAPLAEDALRYGGQFLSGDAGGAGVPGRVVQAASRAVQGATLGGAISGLTSGQSAAPIGAQMRQGAETGAVLGPTVPLALDAGRGVVRALTGASSSVSPEVAQVAQLARDKYGITLKAPQLGLSPALSYANSALKMVPGSGAGAENAAVQGQFNRAVAQTFGEDAGKITPAVLSKAQARIGGVLNKIENSASVGLDDGFLHDAANIEANARASLPDQEYAVVSRQLGNVLKNVQEDGTITGKTYGNLIHKGSPLDAALNSSDSNIRNYAGQIKEALRDSLTRSLPEEDAKAYQTARTQYKNLKTVEPLTLRADTLGGALPSTGDISPAALRGAVNKSFGSGVAQAAPGEVPLNDLARIGQMLKEPPSSGTSERGSLLYAGAKLAELGGAAAMGDVAGVGPAAAALGGGMAGGRLAGAYLRSNWLANRMIDNALQAAPTQSGPVWNALQSYVVPTGVLAVQNPLRAPQVAAPAQPRQ